MTIVEAIPKQLHLFDIRDRCDRCTEIMEQKYGYHCCPLGYNPFISHPNPEEALCRLETEE